METTALEMDDIFEDLDDGEGDETVPRRLPDLPDGLMNAEAEDTQQDEESENQEVLAKLKGIKGAAKHAVKRPMPKLDSTRLTGERGIPILPQVFQDVKLKGKGNEGGDLQVVMRYLEHWAHRLFPMMPFDEVLERIERLGTKKDVQHISATENMERNYLTTKALRKHPQPIGKLVIFVTCIKKMRLDMPVLQQDILDNQDDDGMPITGISTGQQVTGQDNQTSQPGSGQERDTSQKTAEDRFETVVQEAQMRMIEKNQVLNNGQESSQIPSSEHQSLASGAADTCLTAEIAERIERNRQLALKRRASKTLQCDQNTSNGGLCQSAVCDDHHATPSCSVVGKQTSELSVLNASCSPAKSAAKNQPDLP